MYPTPKSVTSAPPASVARSAQEGHVRTRRPEHTRLLTRPWAVTREQPASSTLTRLTRNSCQLAGGPTRLPPYVAAQVAPNAGTMRRCVAIGWDWASAGVGACIQRALTDGVEVDWDQVLNLCEAIVAHPRLRDPQQQHRRRMGVGASRHHASLVLGFHRTSSTRGRPPPAHLRRHRGDSERPPQPERRLWGELADRRRRSHRVSGTASRSARISPAI